MISQAHIVRLIEAREYRQLIDRVLANGRCRSALARRTLARPDAAQVAAIGLAIQRICEITYRPVPQCTSLINRLLHLQRENGTFSASPIGDEQVIFAATAVAIRALVAFQSQCASFGIPTNVHVASAIERGVDTLRSAASDCVRNHLINDPVCWAIVLWQLGDIVEFRNHIPVDALLELLDEAGAEIIEDELSRYAHAMAA